MPKRLQDGAATAAFPPYVEVLATPPNAALPYADIRACLKREGAMNGASRLLIAAHARSPGPTLVTNNVAEFGRVPDLSVENWTEPRQPRT